MKRSLEVILVLALAFSLAACGSTTTESEISTDPSPVSTVNTIEPPEIDYTPIISCFSAAYADYEITCGNNSGTPEVSVKSTLTAEAQPENWSKFKQDFEDCLSSADTAAKNLGYRTSMGQLLSAENEILLSGFNGGIRYDVFAEAEPSQSENAPDTHPQSPVRERFENETTAQKYAVESAAAYLRHSYFSREGLIDQLEYEKYSEADATYAADCCGADWYDQAEGLAKQYLNHSNFSYSGLIDQLEFEGFTNGQATWGADHCGADWYDQAAGKAASYLRYSSFSKDGLIDQLEFEGFTHSEAVYGAEQNGY